MHDLKKSLAKYENLNLYGAGQIESGKVARLASLN